MGLFLVPPKKIEPKKNGLFLWDSTHFSLKIVGSSYHRMGKHAGHSPDRPAIQVSRGQWMVAVHFGAVGGTKSGLVGLLVWSKI